MKETRDLLIDIRIELRKLQRDFHKTDLCKRMDEAIYQFGRPQRAVPVATPAAAIAPAQPEKPEAIALALAWQEAAQQIKNSHPLIHAELCRAVLLRMGLPAGSPDHAGGAEDASATAVAEVELAPVAAAIADPPSPPDEDDLGEAILTAVAAGERHLSTTQREIAVGEAVVLSGFEVNPEELIAKGDAEIGRVLLGLRERQEQF